MKYRRLLTVGLLLVVGHACAARRPAPPAVRPAATAVMTFVATAYCQVGKTASGVSASEGIVAADPGVLPLGTVIRVANAAGHDGVYRVLDTGADIRGRRLDLFVRDCRLARRFGRRPVTVTVVR